MKMQVWVGGNLPESLMEELIDELKEDIDCDSLKLIDGWGVEQDPIETLIRNFKEPNSIEFEYDIDTDMNGEIHSITALDNFCKRHGLTIKKLMPPCVSDGKHYNEAYYYYSPEKECCIETNGDGEVSLDQTATLLLHEQCWALSLRPQEEMPLLINDEDEVTRLYAKASIAGQPFNEIFKQLLITRVGNEIPECPPFKIIPGR